MSEHVLLVFIRLVHTNSFSIWHDLFCSQSKGELLKRWHTFTPPFWLPWAEFTPNRHERRTFSLGKCRQPITRFRRDLFPKFHMWSYQNNTPAEIRIFIGRKKACDHERDRVYMSNHVTGFNQSKHSLAVGDGIMSVNMLHVELPFCMTQTKKR